jgi:putative aldouronate transport system permease protein
MKIHASRSDRLFVTVNVTVIVLLLVAMIYPLYFTVIASFSDPYAVVKGEVFLWVKDFSLDAYKSAFKEPRLWVGYRNSAYYTIVGVLLNLVVTIPCSYVLSKKSLPGHGFLSTFFIVPMYFGGGLIPTYLIVKELGLLNTSYTLIILGALNTYNMIVTRVYFQTSIPESLYESARIDGANNFQIFLKIALPLAVPIIAVMALFFAVARWNDYYTALIYVSSDRHYPLQMMLRSILLSFERGFTMSTDATRGLSSDELAALAKKQYIAQAMKYSLIFIASAPMLILYPFVQKYFIKGIMIGSLKG